MLIHSFSTFGLERVFHELDHVDIFGHFGGLVAGGWGGWEGVGGG